MVTIPFRDVAISTFGFLGISSFSFGFVLALGPHAAYAQESDFYAGKTVRLTVGTAPGAAYDFMARVVAAHYGRHIPGNPSFVVENMPGAASLVMLNTFTQRAPTDGTAIALPLGGIVHEPRLQGLSRDGSNVHFDARKLNWIGSPAQQPFIFTIWSDTPIRSFEDLKTRETTFGTTSRGGDNYTMPTLTNRLLGTRIRIVAGYKGVNDIFRAMEQGEVHGTGMILASFLAKDDWVREQKARVLVHFGIEPIKRLPEVPAAIDLASDEEAREIFRLYAYKYQTTYPFLGPPGIPEERLQLLRQAFDALMNDENFIADARKFGIDIDPVSGAGIAAIIQKIDEAPVERIEKLKSLINAP